MVRIGDNTFEEVVFNQPGKGCILRESRGVYYNFVKGQLIGPYESGQAAREAFDGGNFGDLPDGVENV